MEGGTKYLVPSKLGLGLIEGYDEIGLVKSVSKPSLRREVILLLKQNALLTLYVDRKGHGPRLSRHPIEA